MATGNKALADLFLCLAPSLQDMKQSLDRMLPIVFELKAAMDGPPDVVASLAKAADVEFDGVKEAQLRGAMALSAFVRSKGMDFSDFINRASDELIEAGTPKAPSLSVVSGGKEPR